MKTNKEILEYLKPYTEMEGIYLKTKVVIDEKVRGPLYDYMVVQVDIQSAWRNPNNYNDKGKGESIKSYLRRNGFTYNEYQQCYMRPYYKKYWR
jgi:hypothetical protein